LAKVIRDIFMFLWILGTVGVKVVLNTPKSC
jgi:hypothetical protein